MRVIADLHIHSKYSRAVSKDMDLEHLDLWAGKKGITVMGTGDFTHPAWFKELREKFEPAEEGLYVLNKESRIRNQGEPTRYLLTVEISNIYKKGDRVRKVHNIVLMPSLAAAEKFNAKLALRGNLCSDGRPILGLDSKELLKIMLDVEPRAILIPAHAWTPWFSIFGSMSGFDSIEECFDELTPNIKAIETGLSCYDTETEVLTEKGWKKFSRVTRSDKICTLNPSSEEIEYQKPQKIHRSRYKGKMYRLKTKRVDLFVTPNHNLLYAPADFRIRRHYRLKEARALFGKSKILRKDGFWRGESPSHFLLPEVKMRHGSRWYSGFRSKDAKRFPIRPWIKFFGFWTAEGWTSEGKDGDYNVCIAVQKPLLRNEMLGIIKELGYNPYFNEKIIRIRDYQLFAYLRRFGKAAQKHVPLEVKKLSRELLQLFLEYYLKGDGHVYGRDGKGRSATTISVRLRDDLQEIALKTEDSAYYKLHNKKGTLFNSPSQSKKYRQSADSWVIYFIRHNRHSIIPSTIKKYGYIERWMDYDGMVYCVSVPNRTLYVRRNGIPVWCGNSDPAMNWRLSALDKVALISNSDAHSPAKIGREANIFETELSYSGIIKAIESGISKNQRESASTSSSNQRQSAFLYTVEFFPEEGKYHYDGHRACEVSMKPAETKKNGLRCPACGRGLTIGVLHRVEALADRPEGYLKPNAVPYKSLIPLEEIIGDALGLGPASKKVREVYDSLIRSVGPEFTILVDSPINDIEAAASSTVAEAVRRVRDGKVEIAPGYDGRYGKIQIFLSSSDRTAAESQTALF